MNKKVEVIIGVYPNQISLDLSDNAISIALQYSIDDVRNIDKKNTNYSKTITVPGTKKNNKAFGSLFDVNATFDQFNPNLKIGARIVVDSSPVLEGYLQLTKVKKLNNADLQGNKISYEVVVFDDSIDFIQTLGDLELVDLDLDSGNHIYGKTAIEYAWSNHTFADLYQYPLLDKIGAYETKDFKPSFYHKGLLLKIAETAGYSLEGSFIDNNTQYDKELISWDGDNPIISDQEATNRQFKAGLNTDILPVVIKNTLSNSLNQLFNESAILSIFPDTTTAPFFDNTGNYATATKSTWTSGNKGSFNFETSFKTELSFTGKGVTFSKSGETTSNIYAAVFAELVINGTRTGITDVQTIDKVPDLTTLDPSVAAATKTISKDVKLSFKNVALNVGDVVSFEYKIRNGYNPEPFSTFLEFVVDNNFGGGTPDYQQLSTPITWNQYKVMDNGATGYFKNEVIKDDNIEDGDEISLSSYVPKNIKQKDLLSDIITRYNVYVRKHATKTKTLILETRDDFYSNNVAVLDWTQKKDYSSEDSIKFLSDLQNKEILFSYKEDNSATDASGKKRYESYKTSTGDIYGQKKVSFENDFVKGVKEIKSIFSSAPLQSRSSIDDGENHVIVPAVSSGVSKRNSVLLYWGGLIPTKDQDGNSGVDFNIRWGASTSTPTTYTTYPYAGHYDNPYNPTLDIHFGQVTYEYYGTFLNNITDNNLFNQEWRNYINQISNGKLVTSKFYLKETDINFIKDNLNARIFIKDSYYNINKIVDYKPLEDGLTTVELLRIDQGSDFTPTDTNTDAIADWSTFTSVDQFASDEYTLESNDVGAFRSSRNNTVLTRRALVLGEGNRVGENSSAVVNGDNNNIGSNTTGVSVTGSNNTVAAGANNVTIVGDNQTVTESNTSIINGNTLNDTTALANERIYQELEIGSWDWSASFTKSVNHGLSVTEWKTIRSVDYTIINDADNDYQPMTAFGLTSLNATSFDLVVGSSGGTDYDDSAVNRGFITFTYLPD